MNHFDELIGIATLILLAWTGILLWMSWQIRLMIRSLAEERRELRRWKRLQGLSERQRKHWN